MRTADRMKSSPASEAERAIFMQAEAFHDYRYSPSSPSGWTYLAQVAAATTDFPGFQSLAGSLDLMTLRLQAGDGAVLLWETLLDHYPDSSVKPLALYRLGWAYRNTSVEGLPRDSDRAFETLLRDFPDSEWAPFAKEALLVPRKLKSTATTLSLIPGMGQGYTGHWGKGAARLSIAAAALAMVVAPAIEAYQRQQELSVIKDWPLLLTGLAGLVVLSVDYTQAYQEAVKGVVEFNEAKEDEFDASHPGAP